jgi:hypothetical protein
MSRYTNRWYFQLLVYLTYTGVVDALHKRRDDSPVCRNRRLRATGGVSEGSQNKRPSRPGCFECAERRANEQKVEDRSWKRAFSARRTENDQAEGNPMNFLHSDLGLLPAGSVVQVQLDAAANVKLLDPSNFEHYRRGESHHYYGGQARRSPVRIPVPATGHWHLALDLGGASGTIRHSIAVIRAA